MDALLPRRQVPDVYIAGRVAPLLCTSSPGSIYCRARTYGEATRGWAAESATSQVADNSQGPSPDRTYGLGEDVQSSGARLLPSRLGRSLALPHQTPSAQSCITRPGARAPAPARPRTGR